MSDHVILLATPHGWTDYIGPGENRWPDEQSAVAAILALQHDGMAGTMIPVPSDRLSSYELVA